MSYESAQMLAKQGHIVYGSARRVEKMEPLKQYGVKPISLDVTDSDSCHDAVKTIIDNEGRIDVLINNAGYGSYGAVEDVTIEEAKRQFGECIWYWKTYTVCFALYESSRLRKNHQHFINGRTFGEFHGIRVSCNKICS